MMYTLSCWPVTLATSVYTTCLAPEAFSACRSADFSLQVLPRFYGIRFSAYIAAGSALTVACELVAGGGVCV